MVLVAEQPSFGVVGVGAIGGVLAALLYRAGCETTCAGRPESVARVRASGIRVRMPDGEFTVRPPATDILGPADVVFIAVKAAGLDDAMDRIGATARSAILVPLQNGVGHLERLRARLGDRVVAATIGMIEAYREGGAIVCATKGPVIEVSPTSSVTTDELVRVAKAMEPTGVSMKVVPNEVVVSWGKLTRLAPMAGVTAASGLSLGECRAHRNWSVALNDAVRETVAVAAAEGYSVSVDEVVGRIQALPDGLRTSLQRDVARGDVSEADAILGGVVRAGRRHNLPCPTMQMLDAKIRSMAVENAR